MGWIAVGMQLLSTYNQNNALIAQGRANVNTAKSYWQSTNYSIANMDKQRRDAFEAATDELAQTRLQGLRLVSSVNAAVNEGIMGGGRTANLISRSASNDLYRATDSVKSNYSKKSNEIDLNIESAALSGANQVKSIQNVEAPSFLSTALDLVSSYYQGKNMQEEISARRSKAGVSSSSGSRSKPLSPVFDLQYTAGNSWGVPRAFGGNKYTFAQPSFYDTSIDNFNRKRMR